MEVGESGATRGTVYVACSHDTQQRDGYEVAAHRGAAFISGIPQQIAHRVGRCKTPAQCMRLVYGRHRRERRRLLVNVARARIKQIPFRQYCDLVLSFDHDPDCCDLAARWTSRRQADVNRQLPHAPRRARTFNCFPVAGCAVRRLRCDRETDYGRVPATPCSSICV